MHIDQDYMKWLQHQAHLSEATPGDIIELSKQVGFNERSEDDPVRQLVAHAARMAMSLQILQDRIADKIEDEEAA